MMTPQEVGSRSFAKATLGGYNLAQVDEFLDLLTEDYTALFNENAILKNKLKVLSEKVEEYRATEETMRKTLLAAQKMADDIVAEAKKQQAEMVGEAEKNAQKRVTELQQAVTTEEYRLKKAQESTAAYVRKLADFHEQEMKFLSGLGDLVPPEIAAAKKDDPSADIKTAVAAKVFKPEEPTKVVEPPAAPPQKPAPRLVAVGPDDDVPPMPAELLPLPGMDDAELDPDATRRFSDMKFGRDYKIE